MGTATLTVKFSLFAGANTAGGGVVAAGVQKSATGAAESGRVTVVVRKPIPGELPPGAPASVHILHAASGERNGRAVMMPVDLANPAIVQSKNPIVAAAAKEFAAPPPTAEEEEAAAAAPAVPVVLPHASKLLACGLFSGPTEADMPRTCYLAKSGQVAEDGSELYHYVAVPIGSRAKVAARPAVCAPACTLAQLKGLNPPQGILDVATARLPDFISRTDAGGVLDQVPEGDAAAAAALSDRDRAAARAAAAAVHMAQMTIFVTRGALLPCDTVRAGLRRARAPDSASTMYDAPFVELLTLADDPAAPADALQHQTETLSTVHHQRLNM